MSNITFLDLCYGKGYLVGNSANLIFMNLAAHQQTARVLFWFAQILGLTVSGILLLFIGGNVVGELLQDLISIREEYMLFLLVLVELLLVLSFVISWNRKRQGAVLILLFSVMISFLYGRETMNFVYFHLPVVISGLLLLFYSYYKEWILKKKP